MPTYKLTYFNSRGLGEVSRQLFHLAGKPFEDVRIEKEEWADFKSKTPFGYLPFLEVDGKALPQSFAIARYLAKEFSYAGKTAFEAAWVDAIGDQFKDYTAEMKPYFMVAAGYGEGDKDKLQKEIAEPACDKFYAIIEKKLKESGSGYIVGSGLTWVDLVIADHVHTFTKLLPGFLDKFPGVIAHKKKIQSEPKLKDWIQKRPVTEY